MKYKNLFLGLVLCGLCFLFTGCSERKYGVVVNKTIESYQSRYGLQSRYILDVVTTNKMVVDGDIYNFNNVGDKYTWVE